MNLKELKKTWDKLSSENELDENQLRSMLRKRTNNLIERIDRNIKIGFGVLFILILAFILDDFIVSPQILEDVSESLVTPNWLLFLGFFSNTLIFTTFLFFVIKYYRVKKSCDIVCDLKETLVKIIDTLKIYQRMFYLALISITLTMAVGFITGLYQGSLADFGERGISYSDIQFNQLFLIIIIGLIVLTITVGGIFLFMRWGFRHLYGNYIFKLKQTLKELEEIDE
jgi:hypothetical protein